MVLCLLATIHHCHCVEFSSPLSLHCTLYRTLTHSTHNTHRCMGLFVTPFATQAISLVANLIMVIIGVVFWLKAPSFMDYFQMRTELQRLVSTGFVGLLVYIIINTVTTTTGQSPVTKFLVATNYLCAVTGKQIPLSTSSLHHSRSLAQLSRHSTPTGSSPLSKLTRNHFLVSIMLVLHPT